MPGFSLKILHLLLIHTYPKSLTSGVNCAKLQSRDNCSSESWYWLMTTHRQIRPPPADPGRVCRWVAPLTSSASGRRRRAAIAPLPSCPSSTNASFVEVSLLKQIVPIHHTHLQKMFCTENIPKSFSSFWKDLNKTPSMLWPITNVGISNLGTSLPK